MERRQDPEWIEAQRIIISIDLIAATKKHLQFLEAVDNNGKLYSEPILQRAVSRYKRCWLPLLAKHTESKAPECELVLPLDCEWIWHCHRLNPVRYMADCKELFGRILDPCCVVISSIQGTCKNKTEEIWKKMYPEEPYELNFDDCFHNETEIKSIAIQSTNYDLVSAVKRQRSFYYQVSRTFMKDDIFLKGAVERYKGFLHLVSKNMKRKSKSFCVPTYDIDLMWHTHQLHPLSYRNDMVSLLGKVLDHDDMDSDQSKGQKLDVGFTGTTKQWKEMFSSSYWRAGAMYRGTIPTRGSNHSNPAESTEIVFVEILIEIVEIRNLSGNDKRSLVLSISKKQHDMLFKGKSRFSLCTEEVRETQVVLFQCEPTGELLLELIDDDSSRSLGTNSISLSESDSKLATRKWLDFKSDLSVPITLGVAISMTPPSPMQHMVIECGKHNGSGDGSRCGGGGGCGGGGCGSRCGGGGSCGSSCGGCRASCDGGNRSGK